MSDVANGVSEAEHLARVERQRGEALASIERVKALCDEADKSTWAIPMVDTRRLRIALKSSGSIWADMQVPSGDLRLSQAMEPAPDEVLRERDANEASAIERVRALHVTNPAGRWCRQCGSNWPCATIRAIEDHP
jgi:hypothetical protein